MASQNSLDDLIKICDELHEKGNTKLRELNGSERKSNVEYDANIFLAELDKIAAKLQPDERGQINDIDVDDARQILSRLKEKFQEARYKIDPQQAANISYRIQNAEHAIRSFDDILYGLEGRENF